MHFEVGAFGIACYAYINMSGRTISTALRHDNIRGLSCDMYAHRDGSIQPDLFLMSSTRLGVHLYILCDGVVVYNTTVR